MTNSPKEFSSLIYEISRNNSEASYKKLFNILYNPVFKFSFTILKSRELAEEVASDVLIKLWQKRSYLLHIENIQVYALVIAKNLSLNVIKKNEKTFTIPINEISLDATNNNSASTPEQILISTQKNNYINSIIDSLPTKCLLVFKLIKDEGLSYKETAEILNISVKTVDSHLVSAMKKLTLALNVQVD